jgi:hypothetical protein
MKIDWFAKSVLVLIAALLGSIALRPYENPPTVMAQHEAYPLYFEPGTSMLRAPDGSQQVMGKVAIDLSNGNIWGFPTLTQDPYPAAGANTKPPTSHPFLLGRFALADIEK